MKDRNKIEIILFLLITKKKMNQIIQEFKRYRPYMLTCGVCGVSKIGLCLYSKILEEFVCSTQCKKEYLLETLERRIVSLPQEIKNKIYKDYLEPVILYDKYIFILYSEPSMVLNNISLREYLPTILSKPISLRYILSKCEIIRRVYQSHKINKKKAFKLMNNGESFSTEILFFYFH